MASYVTLDEAKRHLEIEQDFTDDDAYVTSLIDVAEEVVAQELCTSVDRMSAIGDGCGLPRPLQQAILLTISTYYFNRVDETVARTQRLQSGVLHLVQLYRDYKK